MHLDGFGKTYGLPYQAFDPGTQHGVFAFDLLRMLFPNCSSPYTFFLLNGDMELHRNRHLFIQKIF
jgi:hypothetical protein